MKSGMERYFEGMEEEVKRAYAIAAEARKKGLDPELTTEIPLAKDLAGRVEGLVGPKGVAERIRQLSMESDKEEVALRIAREIAEGSFDSHDGIEETCEQALRTSLAILTEAILAAPIEGIVKVKVKRNSDGSNYLAIYFAGPIRSAGGSAQALVVLIADYIRGVLELDRYKPTDDEVERFAEEVELYNSEASRLQYLPSPHEVREAIRHIPVEITGEPTDKFEVSGYRDLERIETNRVRGGAMLVLAEGVLQKKPKIRKYVEKFKLEGGDWMLGGEKVQQLDEETKLDVGPNYKFIKDLIAGRPVLSHPSAKGGLRLRYGRSRNSGYAATCLHPATLILLDDFIAIGTQIKTERPGKASAVGACDSIEGPLVKLVDGSVLRVETPEEAMVIRGDVEEILFLGDILVNYGDFFENNHVLMPSGYVGEWWEQELFGAGGSLPEALDEDAALAISKEYKIPLHPKYIYYYHDVEKEDIKKLAVWLSTGRISGGVLRLKVSDEKQILEFLGVPHGVDDDEVVVREYKCLLASLGMGDGLSMDQFMEAFDKAADSMELVNSFGLIVRPRAPTYIGARMGRPEKAKERRMKPAVNVLFPLAQAGGRTRDIRKAAKVGRVEVEVARRECPECGGIGITTLCEGCGVPTKVTRVCVSCGRSWDDARERCKCGALVTSFEKRELDVKALLDSALKNVGDFLGDLKGVIGMSSELKIPEAIEKGILRTRHAVYIFKDGTARFDSTDMPLTHFIPREVGVSVDRLRELGYDVDFQGRPPENEDQLLELKCQDIVLSDPGAEYLLRVSKFVDDLLVEFYGLEPYYKAQTREDLLGHLVLGLAPHTSAAILGRIMGFTQAHVGYAHPYFHAAKRRNADGDEDAVFLLMDALMNFSRSYLPRTRGGKMDAPLILTTRIDPREIDDEAHNIDVVSSYPLKFYEATLRYASPKEVKDLMETVSDRISRDELFGGIGFTHNTSDISMGPKVSRYKTLGAMTEKAQRQLELASKIRAVDQRDVAKRVVESHFLPDLAGNLRTFTKQTIRCVGCNAKYRRVPLSGKCRRCGGKLMLTVSKGGVEKYLDVTKNLIEKYALDDYLRQRVQILEASIASVFVDEGAKQVPLSDF
ncbi:MAG: DNA polymerase II large subunit [Candidatus Hydrothermarchaeaceae archaeon]